MRYTARNGNCALGRYIPPIVGHFYGYHSDNNPYTRTKRKCFNNAILYKYRWGGTLENRQSFPLRIAAAVREVWPDNLPLFVRISCTDWVENGWDLPQAIDFSSRLKRLGVDFIDCSSGGTVPDAKIPAEPGYQR